MKISRYIKFPLIFGLLMIINSSLFNFDSKLNQIFISFAFGAIIGIGLQFYSDFKVLKIKPDAQEKDFAPQQNQIISLLCNFEEAFNLCLESIAHLKKGNVKSADRESGSILAKTGINWNSFGSIVEFKLKSVSENATEIQISVKPIFGTTLLDYGESVEIIEIIKKYFAEKNTDLNYKFLESKFDIPIDIKTKEFDKKRFYGR